MWSFTDSHVYPNEAAYQRQLADGEDTHALPPVVAELEKAACAEGLWNLFLAPGDWATGLTHLEYHHLWRTLWLKPSSSEPSAHRSADVAAR
ncbi:hypothetical protein [Streptomyces phaeochromogenes]|uniref:hypothetical protein n=1 Tax=Streptomyces phaeochromogenes TaxID=1923 RepID=UPI002DDBCDC8|nr:hypothetical protein [Streptomyces phaeochromogenes]WRZ34465.1 hypothetical protein OG931_45415 [Streptomyces phaeochromogenes]